MQLANSYANQWCVIGREQPLSLTCILPCRVVCSGSHCDHTVLRQTQAVICPPLRVLAHGHQVSGTLK